MPKENTIYFSDEYLDNVGVLKHKLIWEIEGEFYTLNYATANGVYLNKIKKPKTIESSSEK